VSFAPPPTLPQPQIFSRAKLATPSSPSNPPYEKFTCINESTHLCTSQATLLVRAFLTELEWGTPTPLLRALPFFFVFSALLLRRLSLRSLHHLTYTFRLRSGPGCGRGITVVDTVATLLLHCCCAVVALLLHCCCAVITLLLRCCTHTVITVSLLSLCCHSAVTLLSLCCHSTDALLTLSCHSKLSL
jgi:hypothetical protein